MNHPLARITKPMAAGEKKKEKEYPQVTGQWRHHGITPELIYKNTHSTDGIIQRKLMRIN
jgi:hypothetical protein